MAKFSKKNAFGKYLTAEIVNANTIILHFEKAEVMQSYSTIVAAKLNNGKILLDPAHDYSKTTSKNVTLFLGLTTKERRQAIADKKIELVSLND